MWAVEKMGGIKKYEEEMNTTRTPVSSSVVHTYRKTNFTVQSKLLSFILLLQYLLHVFPK